MNTPTPTNEDSLRGFGFALTAYLLWGFLPLFMKAVGHISPAEVIAHRVIWSIPIAGAVLWATGRSADAGAVWALVMLLKLIRQIRETKKNRMVKWFRGVA